MFPRELDQMYQAYLKRVFSDLKGLEALPTPPGAQPLPTAVQLCADILALMVALRSPVGKHVLTTCAWLYTAASNPGSIASTTNTACDITAEFLWLSEHVVLERLCTVLEKQHTPSSTASSPTGSSNAFSDQPLKLHTNMLRWLIDRAPGTDLISGLPPELAVLLVDSAALLKRGHEGVQHAVLRSADASLLEYVVEVYMTALQCAAALELLECVTDANEEAGGTTTWRAFGGGTAIYSMYATILRECIRVRELDSALKAFKRLAKHGKSALTGRVCQDLCNLCGRLQAMHFAREVVETIIAEDNAGEVADATGAYTWLVTAYAKNGEMEGARGVMAEMREAGVTCNAVTFTSYMQLFVKAGDVEGARGVMAEMREAGVTCNAVTFTSYMQLFVKAGDVEGARGVMAEMREAGVTCNAVTFNSYMQLFVKAGDVERARGVMAEMREAGVTCNAVTFNTLLNCFAKHRDGDIMLRSAEELIQEMDAAGLWADKQSFSAVLRCCMYPPNVERAQYWFRRAVTVYQVPVKRPLADIFLDTVGMTTAVAVFADLGLDHKLLGSSSNSANGARKSEKLCLAYVAGSCTYGERCFKVHPTEGEVIHILEQYGTQLCRFGEGCRTKRCLYSHPGRPSLAEQRRGAKGCAYCNAVGEAGGFDASGQNWHCEKCMQEWESMGGGDDTGVSDQQHQ
jgi:pentatricopeptide repeat protein